jgi:hypothetical protein
VAARGLSELVSSTVRLKQRRCRQLKTLHTVQQVLPPFKRRLAQRAVVEMQE